LGWPVAETSLQRRRRSYRRGPDTFLPTPPWLRFRAGGVPPEVFFLFFSVFFASLVREKILLPEKNRISRCEGRSFCSTCLPERTPKRVVVVDWKAGAAGGDDSLPNPLYALVVVDVRDLGLHTGGLRPYRVHLADGEVRPISTLRKDEGIFGAKRGGIFQDVETDGGAHEDGRGTRFSFLNEVVHTLRQPRICPCARSSTCPVESEGSGIGNEGDENRS